MTTGIPTTYRYNAMRSRLEARWAAFFDLVGWRWVYEPLDANGYIPDFLILGNHPFFVEVGPCIGPNDYVTKTAKPELAVASLARDLLVVGVSPVAALTSQGLGDVAAGWFGEYNEYPLDPLSDDQTPVGGFAWGTGQWVNCYVCDYIGVIHDHMNYAVRPCGHHSSGRDDSLDRYLLEQKWARAGSTVQWKPAA